MKVERYLEMRMILAFALFLASGVPTAAQVQPACGVGQNCPNGNQVPFPVINPMQGLSNVLTLPLRNNQPPPPSPLYGYAPIATPPPVLPPGTTR
jgi:hypothetical protein